MFSRGNESLKNWFQEGTEYIHSSQVSVKGRQVKEAFGAGAFDGEDISQSVACAKSIRPTPRTAMERLELKLHSANRVAFAKCFDNPVSGGADRSGCLRSHLLSFWHRFCLGWTD